MDEIYVSQTYCWKVAFQFFGRFEIFFQLFFNSLKAIAEANKRVFLVSYDSKILKCNGALSYFLWSVHDVWSQIWVVIFSTPKQKVEWKSENFAAWFFCSNFKVFEQKIDFSLVVFVYMQQFHFDFYCFLFQFFE